MLETNQSALASGCSLITPRILLYYAALCVVGAVIFITIGKRIATASPVVTIKMLDMPPVFEPTMITIKAGDTVEWQNVGNEIHHATSDPSLAIKSTEVGNPPGVEPFDSGFLKPGESFSHTFKVPGAYKYACAVHETKGMIGQIVVK